MRPRATTSTSGVSAGFFPVRRVHSSGEYQLSRQYPIRCSLFVIARTRSPWMSTSCVCTACFEVAMNWNEFARRRRNSPGVASTILLATGVRPFCRVIVLFAPIGVPGHSGAIASSLVGNVYSSGFATVIYFVSWSLVRRILWKRCVGCRGFHDARDDERDHDGHRYRERDRDEERQVRIRVVERARCDPADPEADRVHELEGGVADGRAGPRHD